MPEQTFVFRAYTRLKQLQHLLRTGQIDDEFYWKETNDAESPAEAQAGIRRDGDRSALRG
jgi:hypothetical protein